MYKISKLKSEIEVDKNDLGALKHITEQKHSKNKFAKSKNHI